MTAIHETPADGQVAPEPAAGWPLDVLSVRQALRDANRPVTTLLTVAVVLLVAIMGLGIAATVMLANINGLVDLVKMGLNAAINSGFGSGL